MKGFKADLCYWRPGFKFFVPIFVPYSQPNVCPGGNTRPFRLFKWDHMLKNHHLFIVIYAIFQYSPSCHFTDIFKANSGIWHRLCHLYRFINPRVTSCKFTEWWHWTELCKMNLFPQPLNWLIRLKTQFKGITLTPLGRKSSKLSYHASK